MVEQFGVGDDAFGPVGRGLGVHLRDDERDLGVASERRRVIDHEGTLARGNRGPLARGGATGREEGQVDALEDFGGDFDDGVLDSVERHGLAGAPSRCHGHQLGYGKRALLEHPQHLRAHHPGGPDHRNFESLSHRRRL